MTMDTQVEHMKKLGTSGGSSSEKKSMVKEKETLYTALLKAQPHIEAAIKDSKNPHFKSSYADINSVIAACKKALNDVGIVIVQPVNFEGEDTWVSTILVHVSTGEKIESRIRLINAIDMQKQGSAITYARRYSLQSLVLLGAEDDDGNAASQRHPAQPQKYQDIPEHKKVLCDYAREAGIPRDKWQEVHFLALNEHITLQAVKARVNHYARVLSGEINDVSE